MTDLNLAQTGTETGTSIRKFAEICGVSHTEVSRRMTEMGILGTPGGKGKATLLSHAEQARLKAALGIQEPARSIEIFTGNHRLDIQPPALDSGALDLSRFRGDLTVQTFEDPGLLAANAIALIDAVTTAMDMDLASRFSTLEGTKAANKALAQKAADLRDKGLEYSITQNLLARLQNDETETLQGLLGNAQGLLSSEES